MPSEAIVESVLAGGLRPAFEPVGARAGQPPEYREFKGLAERCWAADPRARPSAEELVHKLNQLLGALRARQGITGGGFSRRSALSHSFTLGHTAHMGGYGTPLLPPATGGGAGAGGGPLPQVGSGLLGYNMQQSPVDMGRFPLHIL